MFQPDSSHGTEDGVGPACNVDMIQYASSSKLVPGSTSTSSASNIDALEHNGLAIVSRILVHSIHKLT